MYHVTFNMQHVRKFKINALEALNSILLISLSVNFYQRGKCWKFLQH